MEQVVEVAAPIAFENANLGKVNPLALRQQIQPEQHPGYVYLATLAPKSRVVVRQSLDRVAGLLTGGKGTMETINWSQVRYQHAIAIRTKLSERLAHTTVNRHLSALRGCLKECWRLGLMAGDDYQMAASVPNVKGSRLPAGRAVTDGELRAIFAACAEDPKPQGRRDAAVLALLYGTGLRRSEATQLEMCDFNAETGELLVRGGKGNKHRLVWLQNGSLKALNDWLSVRGAEAGPIICPVNKAGKVTIKRVSEQAILNLLVKRAKEAGVEHFSPHDLRRTFISDLLDTGKADLATVAKLSGHAQVTTTARYDRRGEATKRKAAELLHVPYSVPATA